MMIVRFHMGAASKANNFNGLHGQAHFFQLQCLYVDVYMSFIINNGSKYLLCRTVLQIKYNSGWQLLSTYLLNRKNSLTNNYYLLVCIIESFLFLNM